MIRIVVIAMAGLLYRYSGRPVANLTGTKMEVLRWKNSSCRISSETTRCRYNIGAVHKIKNSAKNMLKRACKSEKQVLLYFSRLERGANEKKLWKINKKSCWHSTLSLISYQSCGWRGSEAGGTLITEQWNTLDLENSLQSFVETRRTINSKNGNGTENWN